MTGHRVALASAKSLPVVINRSTAIPSPHRPSSRLRFRQLHLRMTSTGKPESLPVPPGPTGAR